MHKIVSKNKIHYNTRKYAIITIFMAGIAELSFFIVCGGSLCRYDREAKVKLIGDIQFYVRAEVLPSELPSRQWMAYGMRIAKEERVASPTAARFYAYVASIYSDTLEETNEVMQASLATARLINSFYSSRQQETEGLLTAIYASQSKIKEKDTAFGDASSLKLSPSAERILIAYLERSNEDGYQAEKEQVIPESYTLRYNKIKQLDSATGAHVWKTWVIDVDNLTISASPKQGSLADQITLEETREVVAKRTFDDEEILFFWEGIDNFLSTNPESITVAGIWQNIFFVEAEKFLTDAAYAKNQKILAQGVADALISSWKNKYMYLTPSPSMRLPNLDILLGDSLVSSYPSEHAVVSFAAATILNELVPQKKELWELHANNAANSRLLAGVSFSTDIEAGELLGEQVGAEVLKEYFPKISQGVGRNFKSRLLCDQLFCQIKLFLSSMFGKYSGFFEELSRLLTEKTPQKIHGFKEVAEEANVADGFTSSHLFTGTSWVDYDGDGNLDLLIDKQLYHNTGRGEFVPTRTFPGWGVFGDYNNDGCPDVYIVRRDDDPHHSSSEQVDLLYKNNCDSTFTDVSRSAQIYDIFHGNSVAWADYNNDGYLDIYVTNWGVGRQERYYGLKIPSDTTYVYEPNILYRNNGNGTFTDVTMSAGVDGRLQCSDEQKRLVLKRVKNLKPSFQPAWFDYNNDGFVDLMVVMDALISPFYRNNGDGTFTQITEQAGLCLPGSWNNMGAAIGDYDGDGMLDIYVTNGGPNFLWHNNGDGTFKEVASFVGAQDYGYGWGTEALDYNNDGALDILAVNGHSRLRSPMYAIGEQKHNDSDELFQNKGNGTFRAVGKEEGFSISNEIKYSVAVADYNNDGAVDIFVPTYQWRHSTSHPLLFKNVGNENNWVTVQLIGTKSNRDGVGARIEVTIDGRHQMREVQAGSSYRSQSSPWPTFGLGKNTDINELHIRWPSGTVQSLSNVPINQKIVIKEGDSRIYNSLKEIVF